MSGNLTDMTWWEYVRHVAGTDIQTTIAERSGVAQATVSRWKLGRQAVDAPNAVAIARAFNRSPVEALVVAGFLKPEDVGAQVTITRHEDPSDEQLLELLRRRLERDRQAGESRGNTTPMNAVIEIGRDPHGRPITANTHTRKAEEGPATDVQVAQERGPDVDVPKREAPHVSELEQRRLERIADQIAAGDVPAAARDDETPEG